METKAPQTDSKLQIINRLQIVHLNIQPFRELWDLDDMLSPSGGCICTMNLVQTKPV